MDLRDLIRWLLPLLLAGTPVTPANSQLESSYVNNLAKTGSNWTLLNGSSVTPSNGTPVNSSNGSAVTSSNGTVVGEGLLWTPGRTESASAVYISDARSRIAGEVEGRTFGRPFKKMIAGILPVVFQLGMASAWAVLAALTGLKTLAVATLILKLLLLAGALKLGAWFGSKHQSHGWEPPHHPPAHDWAPPHPSKEIHLHIHNSQAPSYEHSAPYSGWNRNGAPVLAASAVDKNINLVDKNINVVYEPYAEGPQTISTPYGNYVKV